MKVKEVLRKYAPTVFSYLKDAWYNIYFGSNLRDPLKNIKLSYRPCVSVIMPVYNVKTKFLREAIDSVLCQSYGNLELCIVDDASTQKDIKPLLLLYTKKDSRIKLKFASVNSNITGASRQALELASGDYIVLFDNDDVLTKHALAELVLILQRNQYDFVYSDNLMISEQSKIVSCGLKPDWSPEFFLSTCYTTHLRAFKRSLVNELNIFDDEYVGAQDIDLICRVITKSNSIFHIDKPLYKWRISSTSVTEKTSNKPYIISNSIKAYSKYLADKNIKVKVIQPAFFKENEVGCFKLDFDSFFDDVIIERLTGDAFSDSIYNLQKKSTVCVIQGQYLLFTTPDAPFPSLTAIKELLGYLSAFPEIGVVSGKVLSSDERVQESAYVFLQDLHQINEGDSQDSCGYWFNNKICQNFLASNCSFMMTPKELFMGLGGFDESSFGDLAHIDYCLRVVERGYRVVFNPWAILKSRLPYHQVERSKYYSVLRQRHAQYFLNDPFYNKNLSQINPFAL